MIDIQSSLYKNSLLLCYLSEYLKKKNSRKLNGELGWRIVPALFNLVRRNKMSKH